MKDQNNDILVSICCITYNHAPYIRQCLDGFIMQKTNFKYEIIVHDDCSTDGTAEIVSEYAEKYPDRIVPILQTVNQYQNGVKRILATFVYPKATGKYISLCEGDDYWIDPLKLQKQVEFLEANPQCTLVVSNGLGYYENKKKFAQLNPIPTKGSKFLTMHEVLEEKGGLIPTASMCFRRQMAETEPEWCLKAPVGDRPLRMWCAINGKVYYDNHPMLVYRIGSVGSFNIRSRNYEYAKNVYEELCSFYDTFDNYTKMVYHNDIQYMKDREEYEFYCRVGDHASKCRSNFYKRFPFYRKILVRVSSLLRTYMPRFTSYIYKS